MTTKDPEQTVSHTPGPWFVFFGPPNGVAVHWSHDGQICPLRWTDGLREQVEKRVIADANLIAAAPDLFAALKALLSVLPDNWGDAIKDDVLPAFHLLADDVDDALAAIAKAEGRA